MATIIRRLIYFMKIQRTKNATRNIVFGTLYRIVATLFPFIMRTILIYRMGADYLGLNNLFTSLLSFLSLAELGVGSAMVYAMYKPIAEEDIDTVCALLGLYKSLYRIIGTVIFMIGILILPFLDSLINGDYPADINLYTLYIIYLANTIISYYMFGYKQSILLAHQRNDMISKTSIIVQIIMYVCQAILLILFRNYYYYAIMLPIFTIVTNFINSHLVDKYYPQYVCRGKIDKETAKNIKKNVLALIGGKLSNTVLHSSDNLVLSAFLGLYAVAIYGNYYYILNSIVGFTEVIYTSLTAGIGNSIVTEKPKKNYIDFKLLSFMNTWLVTWCTTCYFCLVQPFMRIWTGESLMFPISMVILFSVYFYLYQINKIVLAYKDAAGLWWQDRFRPYIVMSTNLIGNIILVQYIGVHGVILSTIISLIISIPWSTYTIYKCLFKKGAIQYARNFIVNALIAILTCFCTYKICSLINVNKYMDLILRGVICCIVPNLIILVLNFRNPDLIESKNKVMWILKRGKH